MKKFVFDWLLMAVVAAENGLADSPRIRLVAEVFKELPADQQPMLADAIRTMAADASENAEPEIAAAWKAMAAVADTAIPPVETQTGA